MDDGTAARTNARVHVPHDLAVAAGGGDEAWGDGPAAWRVRGGPDHGAIGEENHQARPPRPRLRLLLLQPLLLLLSLLMQFLLMQFLLLLLLLLLLVLLLLLLLLLQQRMWML